MPHKRSFLAKMKREIKLEQYLNLVESYNDEKARVWAYAYYDREATGALKEIDNTIECFVMDLEQGEVMIDSKHKGTFQRDPAEEPTTLRIEYGRDTGFILSP